MHPRGLLLALTTSVSITIPIAAPPALSAVSPEAIELRNRGLALLENEKEREAETIYRELTVEAPGDPLGHGNLAIALLRQQKMEEASESIEEALRLAPDRPDLLSIRGAVLVWSGDREAALEALQVAARARPDNLETIYALYQHASSMRGPAAEEAERWAIERLYELRPENLVSLLKLGRSALDREDRATASTVYLRIRELLWQAPQVASDQLDLLLQALEDDDLENARRPSIILDNVLRAEIMYQRGLDELRTNIPGIPVARFVDEPAPTTFGKPVAIRFRATPFEDVATTHSGALTVEDFDGDGLADLARVVETDNGHALEIRLAKNDWKPGSLQSSPAVNELTAFDLNNDGAIDLLGVGGGVAFWLGDGEGQFADSTAAYGLDARSLSAAVAMDFDIEGDLDLVTASTAGLELYRNTLEGALSPVGERSLPPVELGEVHRVIASDLDRDGDLDLLIAHDGGLTFLRNLRQGRFSEATAEAGLATTEPILDVISADLDNDGWPDLVTVGPQIAAWRNDGGHFTPWLLEGDFPQRSGARGAGSLEAFDANNDGRLDLLVAGNGSVEIYTQTNSGSFLRVSVESPPSGISTAKAMDFDRDGDLDIIASGPGGLYRLENIGGNQNHWIDVSLRGLAIGDGKNNRFGLGATVELFLGDAYQFREVTASTTHLGLGQHGCPDVMRVVWTNGVPQNRICAEIDQLVMEEQILKGSCPFLYTWNGASVEFVTDLLWGGPIGMPIGEDLWAGADPHELVRVRGAKAIDGTYDLRITEELWETAYFDLARLWVVDHPEGVEIASTLRIVPGETIDDRIVAAAGLRPVLSAWDGSGREVTRQVRERDEVYASGYPVGPYQGVTPRPWNFEIDLGEAPEASVRLFLDGWIFPADASINLAVAQRREQPIPTRLEALTARGWEVLIEKLGHPAGKTKTMVVDTPPLGPGVRRLRIVSSKWLSWDRIAWSVDRRDQEVRIRAKLSADSAELGYRGFSRMIRRAPNAPHSYLYQQVDQTSPWLGLEGNYTRYGDVRDLLRVADDRSVILAPGDEIRLRFDAASLPPVAPGWNRQVFLESLGWDKDADRNTWEGDRVEPLPFRAMTGYPYGPGESFPDTAEMREYRREWLTRHKDKE